MHFMAMIELDVKTFWLFDLFIFLRQYIYISLKRNSKFSAGCVKRGNHFSIEGYTKGVAFY